MSSTADRRARRQAKKDAKRKAIQEAKEAKVAEARRKETPQYKRNEKKERLLTQIDQVKNQMNENITATLNNYGAVTDLEKQSASLVEQASAFERTATRVESRAYWDQKAKKVYTAGLAVGFLSFALGIFFHSIDVCNWSPEAEDSALEMYECPTMWMALLLLLDIIFVTLFWHRRKLVCCWCDWLRLGRCECCLNCWCECCRKCGR